MVVGLLAASGPCAQAEMTAAEFVGRYDGATPDQRQGLEAIAQLTFNGIYWANTAATLYCARKGYQPAPFELVGLVRAIGAKWAGAAQLPLGAAMLQGLQERFPCAR